MADKKQTENSSLKEVADKIQKGNESMRQEIRDQTVTITAQLGAVGDSVMFSTDYISDTVKEAAASISAAVKDNILFQTDYLDDTIKNNSIAIEKISEVAENLQTGTSDVVDSNVPEDEPSTEKQEKATENGLFKGLAKFFGMDFKEEDKEQKKSLKDSLNNIFTGIKGLAGAGAKKVVGVFDKLKDIAIDVAIFLASIFGAVKFFQGWEKASKWFGENANLGDKIASGFANLIGSFLGMSEEATGQLAKNLSKVFHSIWETLKGVFSQIFGGLVDIINGLVEGNGSLVIEGVKKIWSGIVDGIGALAKVILRLFVGDDKADRILEPLKAAFKMIIDVFQSVWKVVSSIVGVFTGDTTLADVGNALLGLGATIASFFDKVVTSFLAIFGLDEFYQQAKDWVVEKFQSLVSGIIDFVNGIIKYIPGVKPIENPYKGGGNKNTEAPAPGSSESGKVAEKSQENAQMKSEKANAPAAQNNSSTTVANNSTTNTSNTMIAPQFKTNFGGTAGMFNEVAVMP